MVCELKLGGAAAVPAWPDDVEGPQSRAAKQAAEINPEERSRRFIA